jgi:cyclase
MTGVRALVTVTWAAVLCLAQPSAAEVRTAYPEQRGVPLSEFPRLIELADGVYGYEEIRQPGFTTVSFIVVGRDGVLLADGQESPRAMAALLRAIAQVTPLPVKWYVVGSDHADHTGGNSALPGNVTVD